MANKGHGNYIDLLLSEGALKSLKIQKIRVWMGGVSSIVSGVFL